MTWLYGVKKDNNQKAEVFTQITSICRMDYVEIINLLASLGFDATKKYDVRRYTLYTSLLQFFKNGRLIPINEARKKLAR